MPSPASLFRSTRGAVLVSTCALAFWVPRIADACGASQPGLTASVPVDGATYPGNAALLFSGFEISLDAVTVTVDGEPATLVPAEFAASFAELAALVEPAPQAGQTVVVSGSFCADVEFCDAGTITYTASAPDLTAPAPSVAGTFFAVHDHEDFEGNFDCWEGVIEQTLYLHLSQEAPAIGDALVIFQTEWDPEGEGNAGLRRIVQGTEAELTSVMWVDATNLGGADPVADVCFEVRAIDTANNAAPVFEVCPACFFRQDDVPVGPGLFPPEPAWTDADAVPGSACATAAPTTGEDDPTGAPPNDTGTGTGEDDPTGAPPNGTGTGTDIGTETDTGTDDSATGGQDGPDKGCACRSGGVDASDFGRLLLLSMGLGLAVLRRRGRPRMAV